MLTLAIDKAGWRIRYPLDGELRVPAESWRDMSPVELLPSGSKLFWSNDRIEKLLQDAIRRTASQSSGQSEVGEAARPDLSRAIRDWAERYGLSADVAKKEIDRWISEAKQASNQDERKHGLAAFAEQQFEKAAHHFGLAAASNVAELAEIKAAEKSLAEKKEKARLAAGLNFWDQGLAESSALCFEAAVFAYENALRHVSLEKDRQTWAELRNNLGIALQEQAIRTNGEAGTRLLGEAVLAYRSALEVLTREYLPQDWATTQNNLGTALKDQGIRSGGEAGTRLLGEAVSAYRSALEVRTREQLLGRRPRTIWAMS